MKKRMAVCIGLLSGVLALAASPEGGGAKAPPADPNVGKPAPVLNVKEWVAGTGVAAADLKDRAYVVEFWATWCPPCRKSIPHLVDLAQRVMPLGVPIIGLSSEEITKIRPFAEKNGMLYHVGVDGGTSGVDHDGIPFATVIGNDGRIAWAGHPMDPAFEAAVFAAGEAARPDWKPLFALARAGKLGALRGELAKGDSPDHKAGVAMIDAFSSRQMEMAAKAEGLSPLHICQAVAEHYAGLPVAEQAAKKIEVLKADPAVKVALANEEALVQLDSKVDELRQRVLAKEAEGMKTKDCEKMFLAGLNDLLVAFVKAHPQHPDVPDIQKSVEKIQTQLGNAAAGPDRPANKDAAKP